jgi:segregation and condensation protein B
MGTSPDPSNTRIFLLGELRYDLPGDYQTYIGPKGIGGKFEIDPTYAWFGFLPGQCQGWDGPVKTYEFGESGLYADVHVVPEPRAAALLALGTAAAAARRGCRRSARRPDAQRRRRAGSPVGRCPSAILLDNRRAGRGGIITSGGRTSVAGWFFSGCPISRGGRTMRRVLACSLPRSLPRPLDLGDIRGIVKVGFDEEAIVMDDDALLMDRVDRTSAESFGTDAAPGMTPPPPEPEQTTAPFAPSDAPPEAQEAPAPLRHATGPAAQPTPPQIIEALLFASDAPLSLTRLTELVGGCTPVEVRLHIAALNDTYVAAGLSFRIESIARGYRMLTLPRFQPWLARLNQQRSQTRLSPAALETLSIVAYKQPIIRADIEAIRGVACGEVLNRLRDMGLVRIAGRAEVVGRPLMYATTRKFLDTFGLADVDDLPPMEALSIRRPPAAAEPEMPAPAPEPPLAVSA